MSKKPELKLINMADVEATEVNGFGIRISPYGKITIIQGDPGEGKTTLILNLAAMLSKGDKLPESEIKTEPINMIYQTAYSRNLCLLIHKNSKYDWVKNKPF